MLAFKETGYQKGKSTEYNLQWCQIGTRMNRKLRRKTQVAVAKDDIKVF